MSSKYVEYKQLNLPEVAKQVLEKWEKENTFEESINSKPEGKDFVFFEGPPSANGLPGIHHVMGRAIKDIFCRYKTLQGFKVNRKAGWDTHGLPVELSVEKELGITKEDIGTKISVEEYNLACRKTVMRYTDVWNDLTQKMGYWVDMEDPYITYENKYIESVWWLLGEIYNKDLMYKGYTIQPYSPKAGTGLSSHEINQPGCYKDVKDTTVVAQFKIKQINQEKAITITELHDDENEPIPHNMALNGFKKTVFELQSKGENIFFLAWTTTPWTLPSNTALCVGPKIEYVLINCINGSGFRNNIVSAKSRIYILLEHILRSAKKRIDELENNKLIEERSKLWNEIQIERIDNKNKGNINSDFNCLKKLIEQGFLNDNDLKVEIIKEFSGNDLVGIEYEQLLPYALPAETPEKAFQVISGDFVTTEDGTGIVHIAPTFGADDALVAKAAGVPPMLVDDGNGNLVPLVDLQGKFRPEMGEFAGKYVKNEYYDDGTEPERSIDVEIAIKLKEENRAFKVEKYEHSYPHCWRTDKPILYYPLDSWFIKISQVKDRMHELNKTINWKPESTGTGRFGNWLENANDWNLSRSRFWGIPIPIWRTEDGKEATCISSVAQLKAECEKAVAAGFMTKNPLAKFEEGNMTDDNYNVFDLHKSYVDTVTLVSASGQPMKREADLIDVWFDSGSMPIAQHHYPFENKDLIDNKGFGVADFIAEGVDQTRGWFYTLHAIATMVFDRVAYKNVVSNGLVLDKNGQKMSKRLGNGVDPFVTLEKYGPDATRWYMITNAQPWDNLKFDVDGITEVQRKFFGTIYNTYNGFLAVYANIDNFTYSEPEMAIADRPEIDRWVLSRLNSLMIEVKNAFEEYEPTKAGRSIQNFVNDELSNWYVRLCRRRFWRGDYTEDKISAYQTLYTCLEKVAIMSSPIAPFFFDKLFCDLNEVTGRVDAKSVHLTSFPEADLSLIDKDLEYKMDLAQRASSLVLSLRKREKLKVRQPLQKVMIPALDKKMADAMEAVKDLILSEVNVKELEIIDDTAGVIVKKVKPNFKTIGKKYGQQMKGIMAAVNQFKQDDIALLERNGGWNAQIDGVEVALEMEDFEILTEDIPGWLVASEGNLTVALDVKMNAPLIEEGIAREFVNRIQNIRKESGFEVTDRILLTIKSDDKINSAIKNNLNYICSETLADKLELADVLSANKTVVEIDADINSEIEVIKAN